MPGRSRNSLAKALASRPVHGFATVLSRRHRQAFAVLSP
jgi:hypothetical protein